MTGESQGQAGFDAGVAQGFLEKSSLFDGIPAGMVAAVAAVLKPVTLQAGDTLFSQGDAADGLYFLYDGTLEIEATIAEETKIIAGLAPNAVLGNVTKIGHTERFATARATRETLVLSLDEADFATVAENYVNEAETVAIRVGDLWQRLLFARFLRFSPPFNGLPEEALLALEQETEVLSVDRGTIMVSRGDPAEALYIVVNGRLRLWLPKGVTQNVLLRELGPRSILGDVEMLAQRSFMADVRAVRDSVVAKISRPRLELLLERFPLVMNGLLSRSLIRHIDAASEGRKARNTTTTLALVPTTAGVPIVEVGTQLADAISHFGRTLLLNSAICDEWFGVVGAAQTPMGSSRTRMLQSWLNQQEFAHDFTIYTADPDVTNWTRRCVRQADHVLFIAPTDAPPDMGDIEEQVLDEENLVGVRKSLVLLHPEETTIPSRTNDWLVRRRLTMHHHLRRHNGDDMGRLARFLVGRAVALVLGGGGARGFAHVGVLRAMEEAGIPIDLVGGASMGALVGAQLAMQLSGDQIIDNTMGLVKAGDRLTVPAVSLFSAEKFSAGMDKMFGGGMIEDLWRRYFSVSCNLTRARVEVHDKGPLTDAVLASNTP
ncbi:MAG: cyclic nucleotide-binding domain-containing protein, partial [Magnetospiraceae bacterium]